MKIKKTNNPDYGYTNKEELYLETEQHRQDVSFLMSLLAFKLTDIGNKHDWSKIEYFEMFAQDTLEREDTKDFKSRPWYHIHTKKERHHLNANKPNEVNLLDVLEFICDCVAAGKARAGEVDLRYLEIPRDMLEEAFWNTVTMLINEVEVVE